MTVSGESRSIPISQVRVVSLIDSRSSSRVVRHWQMQSRRNRTSTNSCCWRKSKSRINFKFPFNGEPSDHAVYWFVAL